jgi:hypothetical protein
MSDAQIARAGCTAARASACRDPALEASNAALGPFEKDLNGTRFAFCLGMKKADLPPSVAAALSMFGEGGHTRNLADQAIEKTQKASEKKPEEPSTDHDDIEIGVPVRFEPGPAPSRVTPREGGAKDPRISSSSR